MAENSKITLSTFFIMCSITVNFSPFEKYKLILNSQKHYLDLLAPHWTKIQDGGYFQDGVFLLQIFICRTIFLIGDIFVLYYNYMHYLCQFFSVFKKETHSESVISVPKKMANNVKRHLHHHQFHWMYSNVYITIV
jgi:hypothetical protein